VKKFLLWSVVISFIVGMLMIPMPTPSTYAGDCAGIKVLFDNAHGETAGNADWSIDGAYSSFADALRKEGMVVDQWGNTECRRCGEDDVPITYNVLEKYNVYVIPEPNVNFTPRERAAILMFLRNGGGILFMGDHSGSDRNNDGWDSVEIINGFTQWMATDKDYDLEKPYIYDKDFAGRLGFRYTFEGADDAHISNFMKDHPITQGLTEVGSWGGGVIKNLGFGNANTVIWYNSSEKDVYLIAGFYFKGRFTSIADSGVFDDGTGAEGEALYDGWNYGSDALMGINTIKWLAGCLPAGPQFTGKKLFLYINDKNIVTYDGKTHALEKKTIDAAPFIDKDAWRTLVPVRFVSENMGLRIDWNGKTREVTITSADKQIVLKIGSKNVVVRDLATGKETKQTIDVAPRIIPPGRTVVPLRFISETMGMQVKWKARQKYIIITAEE